MAILERRIAEKGSALDQCEPLLLKTYNVARRGEMATLSNENLYAPFYVWKDAAGISDFLCSAGFKGWCSHSVGRRCASGRQCSRGN